MKIAIDALLLKNQNTGTGFYTHHLLKAISKIPSHHQYTYFIDSDYQFAHEFESDSVKVIRVKFRNQSTRVIWEQTGFVWELNQHYYDLIFCPFFIMPILTKLPTVITIHDMFHKTVPETIPFTRRLYRDKFMDWSVSRAAHIIAVSSFTKQDVLRFHPEVRPNQVSIIYEACAENFSKPITEVERKVVLNKYQIPFDDFFLTVGTLEVRKNFSAAIESIARLLENGTLVNLVLIGGHGNAELELRQLVKQLHLEKQIYFAGYVSSIELPIFYQTARAFIFPSLYEGFGLPILESMQSGTPVIASNLTAFPEIIGAAGFLYNTTDELASLMKLLCEEKSIREQYATLGKAHSEKFSWMKAAEETIAVFEKHMKI